MCLEGIWKYMARFCDLLNGGGGSEQEGEEWLPVVGLGQFHCIQPKPRAQEGLLVWSSRPDPTSMLMGFKYLSFKMFFKILDSYI